MRREALWVLRAQAGDSEALEQLLRSIQPSLLRVACSLASAHVADDIVQETLILIYRKLGQLERPELFRPWAFRIAKRAGARQLRRENRFTSEPEAEALLETIAASEEAPSTESIAALLDSGDVSPASRVVLVLHFQEGLSLPEVAGVLELPLGTVKSRLAYGLTVLRRKLPHNGSRP